MGNLTVLTLEPLDMNLLGNTMILNLKGEPCCGNVIRKVDYPASLSPLSIANGVAALDLLVKSVVGPKLVFGHSQGAQVASRWLRQHVHDADAPKASELSFLLIGNPLRKYGGSIVGGKEVDGVVGIPTPNWTQYPVTDIKIQYDGWADMPNTPSALANANALLGKFARHSLGYRDVDQNDPNRRIYQENTTTYVMIPAKPNLKFVSQSLIEKSYSRPEK